MWKPLHISSFCFIFHLVGFVKYFIYIFSFYILRGRYVSPFLYSFCFIRYEVGMCNPFNLFCFCFICYGVGMLNPLYSF